MRNYIWNRSGQIKVVYWTEWNFSIWLKSVVESELEEVTEDKELSQATPGLRATLKTYVLQGVRSWCMYSVLGW